MDDAGEATVVESARRFLVGLSGVGVAVPVDRGFARGGGVLKQGVGLAPFGYGVPGAGSPMKRCCLFLRWMGRHADGVDLGLWPHVSPSRLVVPLDVHVLRTARALGLTGRRDATLRTAVEVTRSLSEICPEDPCRYDFAMVRAGIEDRRVGASKGFRE